MYKMSKIRKEVYKKFKIENIDKGQYFWLSRRDLKIESDQSSCPAICDRCDPNKRKYINELKVLKQLVWRLLMR